MDKSVAISREEAVAKGYLEDKAIYLKPSPRQGKMIKAPSHVGYFMYEGASINWTLPTDSRGQLINVFTSKEEQRYFEHELDIDLNPYKKEDNFWHTFRVDFTKNPITMHEGKKFDLNDPMDNLRVRVLKSSPDVAPSWEERLDLPSYMFALVEEDYEQSKAVTEAKLLEDAWSFFGQISNNKTKMRDFLSVYYNHKRTTNTVPSDASKEWLMGQISTVIREDLDNFLTVKADKNYEIKAFITKAMAIGAIVKEGVGKYQVVSDNTTWTYPELVELMIHEKEETGDLYSKIKAQLNLKK